MKGAMMARADHVCVVAKPGELREGLFGGILLFVFEILPYLREKGIFPSWSIASRLYGDDPDCLVLPGVLETAYPTEAATKSVALWTVKNRYNHVLGADWVPLAALWSTYFKVPHRINASADEMGDLSSTLGIHYRGNDKNTNSADSNPVTYRDFSLIIQDFLKRPHSFTQIFVATDEDAFVDHLRATVGMTVVTRGAGTFHRNLEGRKGRALEADRAMADCVLLSRCAAVLNTSSALSAFAKVLNADLEIFRCGASKMFNDIPYFPIAYIPVYQSDDAAVRDVLKRTLADDWSDSPGAKKFKTPFASRPRWPRRYAFWSALGGV